MDLQQFVWIYDAGILIEQEYAELRELESKLESVRESRSQEIMPDAIYDHLGRKLECEERAKTFRVKSMVGSVFVIKKSELLLGDVERTYCRLELGSVRMARLDDEIESLERYVEIAYEKIQELNLNL